MSYLTQLNGPTCLKLSANNLSFQPNQTQCLLSHVSLLSQPQKMGLNQNGGQLFDTQKTRQNQNGDHPLLPASANSDLKTSPQITENCQTIHQASLSNSVASQGDTSQVDTGQFQFDFDSLGPEDCVQFSKMNSDEVGEIILESDRYKIARVHILTDVEKIEVFNSREYVTTKIGELFDDFDGSKIFEHHIHLWRPTNHPNHCQMFPNDILATQESTELSETSQVDDNQLPVNSSGDHVPQHSSEEGLSSVGNSTSGIPDCGISSLAPGDGNQSQAACHKSRTGHSTSSESGLSNLPSSDGNPSETTSFTSPDLKMPVSGIPNMASSQSSGGEMASESSILDPLSDTPQNVSSAKYSKESTSFNKTPMSDYFQQQKFLTSTESSHGADRKIILRIPRKMSSCWIYQLAVVLVETSPDSQQGHFDLESVNQLLQGTKISSKAEKFKSLFENYQQQGPSSAAQGSNMNMNLGLMGSLLMSGGLGAAGASSQSGREMSLPLGSSSLMTGMLASLMAGRGQGSAIPPNQSITSAESVSSYGDSMVASGKAIEERKTSSDLTNSMATTSGTGQTSRLNQPSPVGDTSPVTMSSVTPENPLMAVMDQKMADMEARLTQRLRESEQRIMNKLDQLIAAVQTTQ